MIKNKSSLIKGKFAREREILISALEKALAGIDPYLRVKAFVNEKDGKLVISGNEVLLSDINHFYLISFGKAAVKMTESLLDIVNIDEGIVVSNVDYSGFDGGIKYIRGGHPIPDENSIKAGKAILKLADKTKENDLTFVLISGGGSALVEKPLVPLPDLQKTTKMLMNAGADIYELNAVRKHLSEIKGGRLLSRLKGRVFSLIISDVVGDSLDTIASGPTYFDSSSFSDAINVLKKYNLTEKAPKTVVDVLTRGANGEIPETLKESSENSHRCKNILIATNFDACKAAENYLKKKGCLVLYLGSRMQGEAREIAKTISGISAEFSTGRLKQNKPVAIIIGGETTVSVKGSGKGGRNEEFVLAALPFLAKTSGVICSVGTDGKDGLSDAAGAIADSDSINISEHLKLDWRKYLENNDSHTFFEKINSLIYTGKTGTNVADIVIFISSGK